MLTKLMQFNKKSRFSKVFAIFALVFLLSPVFPALAQQKTSRWINIVKSGLTPIGTIAYGQSSGTPPKDIRLIVAGLVQVTLGLLGTIFLIMIILAGVKWMSSQGNATKIAEAKNMIAASAAGLLIVMGALAITIFVTRSISGATSSLNPVYIKSQVPYQSTR